MTVEEVKNAYKQVSAPKDGGVVKPVADPMDRLSTNPNGGSSAMSDADRANRHASVIGATGTTGVAASAAGAAAPAATTTTGADRINQMYDAQKEANRLQLENAYNQNISNAQAAQAKIAPQYQGAANDLAVQFERARRNMNTQAMGSGINTGAASQMGLSQTNEYLRDFGKLRSEEANAMAESERNMLDIKTQYQNAIQAAAADNDYKRAAALLDDYNNQTNRDMQKAQLLAGYGDFSMYANLYGKDVAANMEAVWKAQNPDLAYNVGKMSAEEYKRITGKNPPGTKKSSGGYTGPGKTEIDKSLLLDLKVTPVTVPTDKVYDSNIWGTSGDYKPDRDADALKAAYAQYQKEINS